MWLAARTSGRRAVGRVAPGGVAGAGSLGGAQALSRHLDAEFAEAGGEGGVAAAAEERAEQLGVRGEVLEDPGP